MGKLAYSLLLAALSTTCLADGIECYGTGPIPIPHPKETYSHEQVVKLTNNNHGSYDFTKDGEVLATDLSCSFKKFAAYCSNKANVIIDVAYDETNRLDPYYLDEIKSSVSKVVFTHQSLETSPKFYSYDLTSRFYKCENL